MAAVVTTSIYIKLYLSARLSVRPLRNISGNY